MIFYYCTTWRNVANSERRVTMTDQEMRDFVAENTKNIANLILHGFLSS